MTMKLDEMFKFKLGSIVRVAGSNTEDNLVEGQREGIPRLWMMPKETRYRVVTRLIEECVGGIQLHYAIVGFTRDGGLPYSTALKVGEDVIVASEPFGQIKPT